MNYLLSENNDLFFESGRSSLTEKKDFSGFLSGSSLGYY
jgi:hypothetical protein